MKHEDVIGYLKQVPDEEFIYILREVFKSKRPNSESEHSLHHYFLGTASSFMRSEEGAPEQWSDWEIQAVAYVNFDHYPEKEWGYGPDYGFCQFGTCMGCGIGVRSNSKNGICSVCEMPVYMT